MVAKSKLCCRSFLSQMATEAKSHAEARILQLRTLRQLFDTNEDAKAIIYRNDSNFLSKLYHHASDLTSHRIAKVCNILIIYLNPAMKTKESTQKWYKS